MHVQISGASGLLGSAIRPALHTAGHSTSALVRRAPQGRALVTGAKLGSSSAVNELQWDPVQPLDPQKLNGVDAIIHLAGKNIFGPWTKQFKREVRDSRVLGTRTLSTAAARSCRRTGSEDSFARTRGENNLRSWSFAIPGFRGDAMT